MVSSGSLAVAAGVSSLLVSVAYKKRSLSGSGATMAWCAAAQRVAAAATEDDADDELVVVVVVDDTDDADDAE